MKALRFHGNRDLRLEEVPEPVAAPGEAQIRVDYCGICATDIEEYLYGPKFLRQELIPLITGHEMTGTISALGEGVTNVSVGDRVVINSLLSCGTCWWCQRGDMQLCPSWKVLGFDRSGGLAQYTTWPASEIIKLPEHVTSEAAALMEPSSVAHHAVRRGNISKGDSVAVLGAGTVGLLSMQIAKAKGARVFAIDRRDMSLGMASELGAEVAINSETTNPTEALRELTDGVGPDIVIDAAGAASTPDLAIKCARKGGRVVLVAIYVDTPSFDFNSIVTSEVEVTGSIAFTREDVEGALDLISSGKVQTTPLITERISMDEIISVGFKRMTAETKDVFRILVSPQS